MVKTKIVIRLGHRNLEDLNIQDNINSEEERIRQSIEDVNFSAKRLETLKSRVAQHPSKICVAIADTHIGREQNMEKGRKYMEV